MNSQLPSLIGAAMVLFAYFTSQLKWMSEDSRPYQWLNLIGSGILAVNAWQLRQYGFVLMNGSWVLITCVSFFKGKK